MNHHTSAVVPDPTKELVQFSKLVNERPKANSLHQTIHAYQRSCTVNQISRSHEMHAIEAIRTNQEVQHLIELRFP
jgi:hypothetical protein